MKIATLDIGSNTVRLLLGKIERGKLERELVHREITRLAGGFAGGAIAPESLQRTVKAAKKFARQARTFEAVEIRAVCTGVTRRVNDPAAVLNALYENGGLHATIIDGRLEAHISALGAANEVGMTADPMLLLDVGGFSTEIARIDNGGLVNAVSLEIGAVNLKENFLRHDPPSKLEMSQCAEEIRRVLKQSPHLGEMDASQGLVGTAGTITTLAAMDLKMERYEPYRLNRRILPSSSIQQVLDEMLDLTAVERLAMPGLEKGREDLMPSGALIALHVLEYFGLDRLTVTEGGVLEGLALWSKWPVEGLSVD